MPFTHLPPDWEVSWDKPYTEYTSQSTNVYGSGNGMYCCVNSYVSYFDKSLLKVIALPGQVAQLVRALSWYAKVAGSIPGQGTYKNQPMNA